ncbi:unnamed protein product, partial [Prorocentrum cordatum]
MAGPRLTEELARQVQAEHGRLLRRSSERAWREVTAHLPAASAAGRGLQRAAQALPGQPGARPQRPPGKGRPAQALAVASVGGMIHFGLGGGADVQGRAFLCERRADIGGQLVLRNLLQVPDDGGSSHGAARIPVQSARAAGAGAWRRGIVRAQRQGRRGVARAILAHLVGDMPGPGWAGHSLGGFSARPRRRGANEEMRKALLRAIFAECDKAAAVAKHRGGAAYLAGDFNPPTDADPLVRGLLAAGDMIESAPQEELQFHGGALALREAPSERSGDLFRALRMEVEPPLQCDLRRSASEDSGESALAAAAWARRLGPATAERAAGLGRAARGRGGEGRSDRALRVEADALRDVAAAARRLEAAGKALRRPTSSATPSPPIRSALPSSTGPRQSRWRRKVLRYIPGRVWPPRVGERGQEHRGGLARAMGSIRAEAVDDLQRWAATDARAPGEMKAGPRQIRVESHCRGLPRASVLCGHPAMTQSLLNMMPLAIRRGAAADLRLEQALGLLLMELFADEAEALDSQDRREALVASSRKARIGGEARLQLETMLAHDAVTAAARGQWPRRFKPKVGMPDGRKLNPILYCMG